MADIPLIYITFFIGISIFMPFFIRWIDKSNTILFEMSLLLIGMMWILIFAFYIDNIILDTRVASATVTGGTTSFTYEDELYILTNPDGSPTNDKVFLSIFGLMWILAATLAFWNRRRY